MGQVSMLFTGYLSTMAILCLIYSTIWKRFSGKEFFISSSIIAALIAVAAAISPPVFIITQVTFLVIAVILSVLFRKKPKFPRIFLLYMLMFIFWILSILLIVRTPFPWGIRTLMKVISISIFAVLYYKVAKWTK